MSVARRSENGSEQGDAAASTSLTVYRRDGAGGGFRRPVQVLDEDTFIKKLEDIIEKDFFPDLERLKLQQEYYEATKANDYETIRKLHLRYNALVSKSTPSTRGASGTPSSFLATPSLIVRTNKTNKTTTKKTGDAASTSSNLMDGPETPYANAEPPSQDALDEASERQAVGCTSSGGAPAESPQLGLDAFLAQSTSEDNVSFEAIMSDAAKRDMAKVHNAWLFDRERQLKIKYDEALTLGTSGAHDHESDVSKSLDTWTYTCKNTLMYIPEGAAATSDELLESAKRTRVINHANTRFSKQALAQLHKTPSTPGQQQQQQQPTPDQQMHQQKLAQINVIAKIGVDGREANARQTPRVNGFAFVEPSPSPMPGRLAGDESPMMVWGEIESTPFRLDAVGGGSSTPFLHRPDNGPEFKIPQVPERERLALSLEERASAARRQKKADALKQMQRNLASSSSSSPSSQQRNNNNNNNNSSPASMSDKFNSMSPAAQRLLSSKIQLKSPLAGTTGTGSSSSSGRNTMTPSPLVVNINHSPFSSNRSSSVKSPYVGIVSPSPSGIKVISGVAKKSTVAASSLSAIAAAAAADSKQKATSSSSSNSLKRPAPADSASLTDDLLKLPKTSF